jgi:hypothetical protein
MTKTQRVAKKRRSRGWPYCDVDDLLLTFYNERAHNKKAWVEYILQRIVAECPFPPSAYVLETTKAILREELR